MQVQTKSQRFLAHALALALVVGGSGAIVSPEPAVAAPSHTNAIAHSPAASAKAITDEASSLYIIGFVAAAVGDYRGQDAAFAAPEREPNGRLIDVDSVQVSRYVAHLAAQQGSHLATASTRLGRNLQPLMSFQHAFNGVVLSLSASEANYFRSLPHVALVEAYTEYETDTDAGPNLIGAPGIWDGSTVPSGVATRGEGIVIGVIDTGINFDSPSYAGTEPGNSVPIAGGFAHVNPLGAGNFLGNCAPGGVDAGLCNAKLIGAYDFVFATACPGGTCPGTLLEEASAEDNNGHGSHTASTAGGNAVDATFQGAVVPMSGVARHANLIAYDACFHVIATGGGSCPTVSTLASVNQAVADGIVDVINYSIGGGAQPWTDAVSQAFLTAHNAGIFVSASAGNSGPGASTLSHVEPWVATVGASTHGRKFGFDFDLTGPAAPPANTQNIIVAPGGAPFAVASLVNVPLIVSSSFGSPTNNDGCTAYPANFFRRPAAAGGTQGLAVVRFLTSASACGSVTRRNNVIAAGAAGILFVVDGPTGFGANNTTWQMNLPDWTPVQSHVATDPTTATATITAPFAAYPAGQQADVMAGFSSRGPSGFDLLKPDVIAPGVNILAAYSGAAASVNVISGTSMASPHNAGAGALLRALNPTWTPSEIKSALMTTAKTTALFKENGSTTADPLDRGAGRIDLSAAADAGLIFNESGDNYLAADPANGGQPESLNIASFQNDACVGICNFSREVRNARVGAATYNLAVNGPVAAAATALPASFTIGTTGTRSFSLAVDSTLLPAGVFTFGELTLTPTNPALPVVRLPIAVRPSPPDIALSNTAYTVDVVAGSSTTRDLTISNAGNPTLNWSLPNTPQTGPVQSQASEGNNGIVSAFYNPTFNTGIYSTDDFVVNTPSELRRLVTPGFGTAGANIATFATALTWRIYADNAGVPAAVPETGAPPLFSATLALNAPGVSVAGNVLQLDVLAAGLVPPLMPAGRYWLMVSPTIPGTAANHTSRSRWNWFASTQPSGPPAQIVTPGAAFGGFTGGVYASQPDVIDPIFEGLAFTVDAQVTCGASWLTPSLTSGALGIGGSNLTTLTFDAASLPVGTLDTYLCVSSGGTDPDEPMTLVPVRLNVLPVPTNPGGTGLATPANSFVGGSTLLTVDATPGTNPPSTNLAVAVNLSSIGGSATQTFFDNGTNGDVTASDGRYSFNATIAAGTTAGNKLLTATISDAQARSGTTDIALTINAATLPSGTGAAAPSTVARGGNTLLTVNVTPGTNPPSSGIAVVADLTNIGSSVRQMFDDGTNGDVTATDGTWSLLVGIAPDATPGPVNVSAFISDAQGRAAAEVVIGLTISASTAPTGTGAASPASVAVTAPTLLTVTTTPGTSPASSGVGVAVNLSSIGGSATQQFSDTGSNGDVTAGDGIFSFATAATVGTSAGGKTLTATISDAQLRSSTTDIALTVTAPGALSGSGAATPSTVARGGNTLLTVTVAPGANPVSTGIAVVADLSSIGGASARALFDDGSNGDVTAGDNVWSLAASVSPDTVAGAKSLAVTISDAQARAANTNIALTVSASVAPSAVGAATPASAQVGGATVLTVTVTPGSSPASTGIGVVANLTGIGGGIAQTFYDDGTNGDLVAGDNVFSFATTVVAGTTLGAKSMPVSIADAQLRTASTNLALQVVGPSIFGSGFE